MSAALLAAFVFIAEPGGREMVQTTPLPAVSMPDADAALRHANLCRIRASDSSGERYELLVTDSGADAGNVLLSGNAAYPLNRARAAAILRCCAALPAQKIAEDAADLQQYGLDAPVLCVEMENDEGEGFGYAFGSEIPSLRARYAMDTLRGAVYAVDETVFGALNQTEASLHALEVACPVRGDDAINLLRIERPGEETVEIRNCPEGEYASVLSLRLTRPFPFEVDAQAVSNLVNALRAVRPVEYAGEMETVLACGLDGDTAVRCLLEGANGARWEVWIGNDREDGRTFVRFFDEDAVYLADTSLTDAVRKMGWNGLCSAYCAAVDIARVSSLLIQADGRQHRLEILADESVSPPERRYRFDGAPARADWFRALYKAAIAVERSAAHTEVSAGECIPVLTFVYEFNNGMEPLTVEFLPYDGQYHLLRRNGETRFLVKKQSVDSFLAMLNAQTQNVQSKE